MRVYVGVYRCVFVYAVQVHDVRVYVGVYRFMMCVFVYVVQVHDVRVYVRCTGS